MINSKCHFGSLNFSIFNYFVTIFSKLYVNISAKSLLIVDISAAAFILVDKQQEITAQKYVHIIVCPPGGTDNFIFPP